MSIDAILKKYIREHLNLKKNCDEECDGNGESCEKCMVIKAHRELREDLKSRLAIMEEVESSNGSDIYSFLTGSYKRGTMNRPPKDIDFFNVLSADDYKDFKPAEVLSIVYAAVADIYPDKEAAGEISVQVHSICVKFTDVFSIDIVPAFEDGANYRIPHVPKEGDDSWLISNPKKHVEVISEVNNKNEGKFLSLARLLKAINRNKIKNAGIKVKSFHLEMAAEKIFRDGGITSYTQGLADFFKAFLTMLDAPVVEDPANSENFIDDYLTDDDKYQLKGLFTELAIITSEAVKLEEEDRIPQAIEKWKKVFNDQNFNEVVKTYSAADLVSAAITSGGLYLTSDRDTLSVTPNQNEQRRVPRSSSWGK